MYAPRFGFSNFLLLFILLIKNNHLYSKAETMFCASVCVHTHAETKRHTDSKFGTEIVVSSFE